MSFFNMFKKADELQLQGGKQDGAKPDLDSTFFNMKVKQLPANFAQSVMDLEMKLEFAESCDIEAIQQLNQLYRLAVEYYIHEDAKKARHFQRKLASLLSNPQTLSIIDQSKQKPTQKNYQFSLRNEMGQFNSQSNTLVTQIIEGSDKKLQKTGRIVNQQIIDQETRLRSRLEHRSNSRQSRRGKKAFLSP